jgi:hypothetical protein
MRLTICTVVVATLLVSSAAAAPFLHHFEEGLTDAKDGIEEGADAIGSGIENGLHMGDKYNLPGQGIN